MNRRPILTTGIVLSTLSLLYLGGSAYRAHTPFKVDTLGNLHAPTLGQADAPESMVVFTDYRCPHCRAFEGQVMPNVEKLVASGALSLTVVPIGMLGEDSRLTAAGALCAARQGEAAFSALHKALFELPGVNREALVELTGRQGLESQQVRGCLEDGSTAQEVEQNTLRAREIGIRGTPSVVVSGKAYANPDWNTLQGAIREGR
jgi:protein-disulfide isomerase